MPLETLSIATLRAQACGVCFVTTVIRVQQRLRNACEPGLILWMLVYSHLVPSPFHVWHIRRAADEVFDAKRSFNPAVGTGLSFLEASFVFSADDRIAGSTK